MARALGTCTISAGGVYDYVAACTAIPNVSGDKSYRNSVPDLSADIQVLAPTAGGYQKTVVCTSGGGGGGLFSALANVTANLFTQLRAAGCRIIQVQWRDPAAFQNTGGWAAGTQGPLALAARVATAYRGIYDFASLHDKTLPFIIMGQSGGSSGVAYTMAHYGGGDFVDMAILCSGPPHARMDYLMLGPQHKRWTADIVPNAISGDNGTGWSTACLFFDYSEGCDTTGATGASGYRAGTKMGGPENRAINDSVMNMSAAMLYPLTDFRNVCGDGDQSGAATVGRCYTRKVTAKSTDIVITTGSVGHTAVPGSTSGSATIIAWIAAATLNH